MPNRPAAKALSAADIEKRLADEQRKLAELGAAAEALEGERETRKKSDPNLSLDDLSEFDRREKALRAQILALQELIAALGGQVHGVRVSEWAERKRKRHTDLELCAGAWADAKYKRLDGLFREVRVVLGELKAFHFECVEFNLTTDDQVGFVELPENRIRGKVGILAGPLWDELSRVRMVYPGDGLLKVEIPNGMPVEEARPKPPATPAPAPQRSLRLRVFSSLDVVRTNPSAPAAEQTPAPETSRPLQSFIRDSGSLQLEPVITETETNK